MNQPPITQTNLPPGFIDLGNGNPDSSLLPLNTIHESAESYFSKGDSRSLQYGSEQGDGYFRYALAYFLASEDGITTNPDNLFVTNGASSALDLICTLFTVPGDTVFVEEPTYHLALRIFKDHHLRVVPIPMDTEGLRLDLLEDALTNILPKFIYTIPVFQNPTGLTLSANRRQQLVEWAQRHDILVVADEVYRFLHYGKKPPAPLASVSENVKQVISVNSFSKILAPGLRLGWIQAHHAVIEQLTRCGLLDSGGGMNPFTSALLREMIESGGLNQNIKGLRQEYAQRLNALDAALHHSLPTAEYIRSEGGFFFWVRLPGVNINDLLRKAKKHNVGFRQGGLFTCQEDDLKANDAMRLSFSFYGIEAITAGIKRIKESLEDD